MKSVYLVVDLDSIVYMAFAHFIVDDMVPADRASHVPASHAYHIQGFGLIVLLQYLPGKVCKLQRVAQICQFSPYMVFLDLFDLGGLLSWVDRDMTRSGLVRYKAVSYMPNDAPSFSTRNSIAVEVTGRDLSMLGGTPICRSSKLQRRGYAENIGQDRSDASMDTSRTSKHRDSFSPTPTSCRSSSSKLSPPTNCSLTPAKKKIAPA